MPNDIKSLRERLENTCRKRGGLAFGVASAEDADGLDRVRIIDDEYNGWSEKISSIMPDGESVIVFGIGTFDDADELSIRRSDNKWIYPGYDPLAHIARDLIEILENEGYKGKIPPESVTRKPIAVLAGIGSYGKNSMILSEENGLSLRLEIIVTNAPFEKDKSYEKDLCRECDKCVRACPTKALEPFVLDLDRCLVHITEVGTRDEELKRAINEHTIWLTPNTVVMCTICQMACPYTSEERKKNRIRR